MLTRRLPPEQYSLSDMAEDTAALLRELGIAPAHVVGASMGGMIGQTLAAEHPEVVRSLTSIMSTTGNRWRGQPAPPSTAISCARRRAIATATSSASAEIFGLVGSTGFQRDDQYIRERAARAFDRGFDVAPAAASSGPSSPRATGRRRSRGSTSRRSSSTAPSTR